MMQALGTNLYQEKIKDTMSKKVYVIIVTYNGMKWIDKCFSSLRNSSIPLHVLAIDNNSIDETAKYIKEKFTDVYLIEMVENVGFGKANNIGFTRALEDKADYVFLLNQDAWVECDSIEQLVNIAEKNIDYGVISPIHISPNNTSLEWHFSTFISADKCPDFVSDMYFNKKKEIYSLPFVNAAAWLISKECILKVGGFDPLFPHYGEDDDYCNRVLYKNFKIGVTPNATITHDAFVKTWNEIKSNEQRQFIFSLIELKNMNASYKYLKFNFIKTRIENLFSLLFTKRWKEFIFMSKVLFNSITYFSKIGKARKIAKEDLSYLK